MSDLLKTVESIYAAFGRGDIPGILGHLADDVAWEEWSDNSAANAGVPWLQPRRGRSGAAEFFALLGSQIRLKDFRVLSMMAGPSQVAVEFVIEADVTSTGGHYRDEEIHLWTFNAAGEVTRLRHYTDTAKHMRAAGVTRP
ncbi:MAG: nuclear transport factor 2 family protein [Vicinamibacterales bacterium]